MRWRVTLLSAALLAGCSILTPPDARLCSAAQDLTSALSLTTAAVAADQAGDVGRAAGLATQAISLGELADAILDRMPDDAKTDPVWQGLQDVYLHNGQAANVLLPAFASGHEMASGELDVANGSMAKVRNALPAMCFDVPAGPEGPASSTSSI